MKRLSLKIYGLLILLAAGLTTACDQGLEEVNRNPNAPEIVTPDLLLPHGIESAVDVYWGAGLGMDVGNLYAQHWARIQYTDADRYLVSQDIIDHSWRNLYIESLADFQRIHQLGLQMAHPNYTAVALIMRSWVFSILTDVYGDIPYSQALQGLHARLSPAYDGQKEVYAGMIRELKAANDLIDVSGASVAGDILYHGQMLKWKKFANSLSLRLLTRMLHRPDAPINVRNEMERILNDPVIYPVFTGNDEAAMLQYLPTAPNNNPVHQNRVGRDDYRISQALVQKLQALGDGRLAVYAERPEAGGNYQGVPNGLLVSEANALGLSRTSKVGAYFTAATAPAVLMSYAEVLFLKAEAGHQGITAAGDPAQNYAEGIKASFQQYGLTADAAYLKTHAYQAGAAGYRQILEQKWIALYGQGLEAWTEQRRTGIPALQAPTASTNNGLIPTRLPYPSSEESLNYANFKGALDRQGGPNTKTLKLWWAK
jgi:hypothetical protein